LLICSGAVLPAFVACHRTPSADVVATVNGKEINRSELERKYLAYKVNLGPAPQEPSDEQANIARLGLLRTMIDDEILQERAAKFNLVASDEDVNAKVTDMRTPFTQEGFDNELKKRDETLDDLKRDIRHQLTQTKLLNKEIEAKINITDAAISTYYNAHKADFNLMEPQYNLAQIVVTDAPNPQAGNLQNNKASGDLDAKKKIQILHNKLANGEDFSTVAMNFSEDPNTAANGGDLGFVSESNLHGDPLVYDAVSKLKPGQMTEILPVPDNSPAHRTIGYRIFKLLAHEPAGQRELNDPRVQQSIRQLLHDSKAQLLKTAYFEVLHSDAKVHNYFAEQILKQSSN
jgi:peptidyl-prolyl cis-trans isomerase SurA